MKLGKQVRPLWAGGLAFGLLLVGVTTAEAAPAVQRKGLQKATAGSIAVTPADALARANTLLKKGDRAGALKAYESAVTADAKNPRLWQVIGDLHYALDHALPAVDAWSTAAALAPWDDHLAERESRGSVRLGDYERAARAQARLVSLLEERMGNEGVSTRNGLGLGRSVPLVDSYKSHLGILSELYVLAGDFTAGEEVARKLIRFAPSDVHGRLALAYVHLHAAEYDESAEVYEDVLRVAPDNGTALNNLGNIQYMRRDFNAAAELFERILETDGTSKYSQSIATANLAELLQIQSAFKDAEGLYAEAIQLQPEGAWGYMGMAALLDVTGRYDAAVDQMISGWERDQNQLTRLNMHFYEEEWAWQRDALIAEIEGNTDLATSLWRKVKAGNVTLLHSAAAWHLRSLAVAHR